MRRLACLVALAATLFGCGRGDQNLWDMRFPGDRGSRAVTRTELTGYWQGDVSMGGVRLLVEPSKVTVALRCDAAGDKVSQASAPIAMEPATSRLVLQDALAGGDKDCGFRFEKGDALGYALAGDGRLEVAFGNASVSRLEKIADVAPPP